MEAVKILLALCLMLECCNCWVNQYDAPVWFECPAGQAITHLSSEHSNYYEDRRWDFKCADLAALSASNFCTWSRNVNEFEKLMDFKCQSGGAIAGLRSAHSDHYEDRVYDIKCCRVAKHPTKCYLTKYVNRVDAKMNYGIPSGMFLHGIYSVHRNYYQDRIYKFYVCETPEIVKLSLS